LWLLVDALEHMTWAKVITSSNGWSIGSISKTPDKSTDVVNCWETWKKQYSEESTEYIFNIFHACLFIYMYKYAHSFLFIIPFHFVFLGSNRLSHCSPRWFLAAKMR
jgi:hypothetical protein